MSEIFAPLAYYQRMVAVPYREFLTLENGNDKLYRNVGKVLPPCAA